MAPPVKPLRTVVWSTGGVGTIAIDAIRRRPDLELVGVWVHSPEKDGRDVGELAGGGAIGLAATNDAAALIALEPDCVVYAASGPERRLRHVEGVLDVGQEQRQDRPVVALEERRRHEQDQQHPQVRGGAVAAVGGRFDGRDGLLGNEGHGGFSTPPAVSSPAHGRSS